MNKNYILSTKHKIKQIMYKNKKTELVYKFLRSLKNNGFKETYKKSVVYYRNNVRNNIVQDIVPFNDPKIERWKNPNVLKLSGSKRSAIFASYSFDKTIPEYVIYYLKKLRSICDYIVLVCDNDILESEKEKIIDLVDYAEFGRHGGYDFNSYKKGYLHLLENGLLDKFDSCIFANDSCYGPIFDLADNIKQMNEKKVDFWGLLDSIDGNYHIQSFFYYLNKDVMLSKQVKRFFDELPGKMSWIEAVENGEKKFTLFIEEEFTSTVLFKDFAKENCMSYLGGNRNSTLWPVKLLKNKFPLIKVKAVEGSYGNELNESSSDALNIIYKANHELYEIILRDLKRRKVDVNVVFDETATNFYNAIKDVKIVSFDIFDTLLIRPFVEPTDLFDFIEITHNISGFKKARILAEQKARSKYPDEIKFDEIYECIDSRFSYLHDIELEYEFKLLKKNPVVFNLYKQAIDLGKKVVATSDMYLSKDFLKRVLDNTGYDEIEVIFVSSDKRYTKGSKKIYHDLLDYFQVKPSDVVHIGDNKIADKVCPEEIGINSYHIKKVIDRFDTPANIKWVQNYRKNIRIVNSIHFSLIARRKFIEVNENKTYWNMLGYRLGGPLALAYLNFCLNKIKNNNVDKILFVARDGWALEKIYKKYFQEIYNIKSSYVYLNRIIGIKALQKWCKEPIYLRKLLVCAKEKIGYIKVFENYRDNIDEYKKHEKQIQEAFKSEYYELREHLLNDSMGNNIALIDTTTGAFSSLNFAKYIFGNRLKFGLFTGTFKRRESDDYYTFSDTLLTSNDTSVINLAELLLSSPEPNVVALKNGEPIYDDKNNGKHAEVYLEIFSGIDEYVNDIINLFGELYSKTAFNFEDWKFLAQDFIFYKNHIDEYEFSKLRHQDLFQEGEQKYL